MPVIVTANPSSIPQTLSSTAFPGFRSSISASSKFSDSLADVSLEQAITSDRRNITCFSNAGNIQEVNVSVAPILIPPLLSIVSLSTTTVPAFTMSVANVESRGNSSPHNCFTVTGMVPYTASIVKTVPQSSALVEANVPQIQSHNVLVPPNGSQASPFTFQSFASSSPHNSCMNGYMVPVQQGPQDFRAFMGVSHRPTQSSLPDQQLTYLQPTPMHYGMICSQPWRNAAPATSHKWTRRSVLSCYKCGVPGHRAIDCTEVSSDRHGYSVNAGLKDS